MAGQGPFLGICLGHQILSGLLGLPLVRRQVPNQGVQREIDLFGRPAVVGFYNSYAAVCGDEVVRPAELCDVVEVCRDPVSHEVHALRGHMFRSTQFHPESVLSEHGVALLQEMLVALLPVATGSGPP